ncbi:MAG: PQQ-dependent sugar dehydrogenase [Chitinophagaceae bacterium]|nr:PQQ-dependent sugar dehydrogenase [Chitinophagaceae bacterium]
MSSRKTIWILLPVLVALSFCETKKTEGSGSENVKEPGIRLNTIVSNQEIIWGMDWLPNGELLFTEKRGKLYRFSGGKTTEITGVPDVNTNGQGGLLDIKVHPDYNTNGWIYCSYAGYDNSRYGVLTLIRFKLKGNTITNTETLLKASTPDMWFGHYGSRIVFDKAGMLYLSIGEGGPTSYGGANSPNMNAQNAKVEWGKIHRMTADGKVPADNPILPGNSGPTTVFSYGHRNPQGLALNPATGEIWEDEHGPRGGDEVNIIRKGRNYGWPLVSFGINYDGNPVTDKPTRPGIEAPVHTWTPSIAPCGMAFITGERYKGWKGNILVGSLAFRHLTRLQVEGDKVVKETKMLNDIGRVRNVKMGPDGYIYISVEGPGRILQLIPE